ncbi:hypothetical protein HP459_22720 [Enterobacter sp. CM29]|uniref:hypothetical protein n=1 Tax=Enterobacter sp. CM29 TaxID=2738449 RepID=UPI0015C52C0D|nr:hypothetical protein [Enterobacter sp. CM29]NQD64187.1 hypothetical protein [Enterobacter sp. CM29]
MFEQITDGINFFTALVLSVIICGLCIAAGLYYHFSDARRYSYSSGSLADFMDMIPEWVMNTILTAWLFAGTIPLLNYKADKEQFGSIIGRAREMSMFDERPWYGEGGYQFLCILAILIAGYLIHRFQNR